MVEMFNHAVGLRVVSSCELIGTSELIGKSLLHWYGPNKLICMMQTGDERATFVCLWIWAH